MLAPSATPCVGHLCRPPPVADSARAGTTIPENMRPWIEELARSGNLFDENRLGAMAWADEVLLATPWAGAGEWARNLLQRRHFNVTNAGDAFFKRLEVMEPEQIQVREVYFYCLSLGFAGRYGYDRNAKALADIRQASLLPILRAIRAQREGSGLTSEMEKLMFPDGYAHLHAVGDAADSKPAGRWGWKFSSLTFNVLLIPLIILIVLYAVYHITIWQMVNSLLAQVK